MNGSTSGHKQANLSFPWKALIICFIAANLFGVYDVMGVHDATAFDYTSGTLMFLVVILGGVIPALAISGIYYWLSNHTYKYCLFTTGKLLLYLNAASFFLVTVYFIADSKELNHFSSDEVTYIIETKDVNSDDLKVLRNRLIEALPSRYSRVNIDKENSLITFTRGAPDSEKVEYLSTTRGVFTMKRKFSTKVWISNSDIRKADVRFDYDGTVMLGITLKSDSSSTLYNLAKNHIGDVLTVTLDEKTLIESEITNPLYSSFMVSIPPGMDENLVSNILNNGALGNSIKISKN